jgi:hypothetical protein
MIWHGQEFLAASCLQFIGRTFAGLASWACKEALAAVSKYRSQPSRRACGPLLLEDRSGVGGSQEGADFSCGGSNRRKEY